MDSARGQGKGGGEYHGRSYIAPPRPLTLALMPFFAAAADDSAFAIAGLMRRVKRVEGFKKIDIWYEYLSKVKYFVFLKVTRFERAR